jgi:predicted permease
MRFEHWIYTIPLPLRSLSRRNTVDQELEEELRDHIEQQTEANISKGMARDEARRRALIELGGLEQRKQQCREAHGVSWISDFASDLDYGLRGMRRNPGFTIAALSILALGIGANTAIFSTDDAILFRKLPYHAPDRLVEIFQKDLPNPTVNRMPVSPANYVEWQKDTNTFESFAAWRLANLSLSGEVPERIRAAEVTANLFSVLGVSPALGRAFESSEDAPGKNTVAVLSYTLWQRRFAGDKDIIGKTFRANQKTYTVIGVTPPGFRFPIGWLLSEVEVWTPLALEAVEKSNRKDINLDVIARLRPNATVAQAQASLETVARQLAQAYPETNKDWGVNVILLSDRGTSDLRSLFGFLSLAVGLVLLIACANVANLLLARSLERQKELTVRTALGARRSRLVRQLTTEGILLSFTGGILGIGLAYLGVRVLAAVAPTMELPDLKHATLNAPVLAVSLLLSVLTGFLFSIFPALTVSSLSLHATLQATGRLSTTTAHGNRAKAALMVGELALTLALLMCAGGVLESFHHYMNIDPGFEPRNVLTMRMLLPKQKYPQPQERAAFYNEVVEGIKAIAGVTDAAAGSGAPMEGAGSVQRYYVAGRPAPRAIDFRAMCEYFRATPSYFRTAGMRLLRGRDILPTDSEGKPAVAVVNEEFVRREFSNSDPIGQRVILGGDINNSAAMETQGTALEIVGVVHDTKEYGLYHMTPAMIYTPLSQAPDNSMALLVKTAAAPDYILREVRRRIARLDPDQAIYNTRSLEDIFRETHAFFRFNTLLLSVFALMALVLSIVGIYGVIAYAVGQRTREFGIRLALGASRRRIMLLVLRQSMWMSAFGIAVGAALSWPALRLLTRTLKDLRLDLTGSGPALFASVCAGMALTMLVAAFIPARRATKADPMQALRCE